MRGVTTRWALTALVIGLIVLGTGGFTQADGPATTSGGAELFADVPAGHWALDSLQFLAERGVIEGLPNGQFQGDRAPSRYEVAVMLARALQHLESQAPQGPVSTQTTAANQLRPEDIKVLQDLIFKISDRLQQLSGEVNALKTQRPEIDPDLAERIRTLETQREEIEQLRAQIEQDQQAIRDLKAQVTKFQVQASTVSEETVAKTNQQVLANRIIGLFALGAAVVGVALATLR